MPGGPLGALPTEPAVVAPAPDGTVVDGSEAVSPDGEAEAAGPVPPPDPPTVVSGEPATPPAAAEDGWTAEPLAVEAGAPPAS